MALEVWKGDPWPELADRGRSGDFVTVTTADGVKLHVEVEGPSTAGVTVVFCHGLAMSASAWRHQRAALADSAVRRVSYDARGHGRSGTGKLDQNIPGVWQLADDLGRVIDATAPTGKLVVVGHSMGGMSALALADMRPDLADRIAGYVLCSTSSGQLSQTMTFGLWPIFAPVASIARREVAGLLLVLDALPTFVPRLLGLMPYGCVGTSPRK